MYLVPPEIYSRLLDSADAREKIKVQELNATEVGNENGAFPNLPITPDHDANTSQDNDDEDDNDYGGGDDDDGRYNPPPTRPLTSSSSSSSRQSSHGSSTDTASETENYLQNNPNNQNAVLSNSQQRFLQQYSDSEDENSFSNNFVQHPQLLRRSLDPVITPQPFPSTSSQNLFSSNFARHPQLLSPSIDPVISPQPVLPTSSQNLVLENNIGPELERIMNDMIKIRSAALQQQRVLQDINKKAKSLKTKNKSKTNNIIQAIEHISQPSVNNVNNQQQTLRAIEYIPQQPENQTNPSNSQTISSGAQPLIPQPGTRSIPSNPQTISSGAQPLISQPGTRSIQDSSITQSSGAIRKSYPCDICKLIFITNRLLIQHKKNFHSSKTKEIANKSGYINWKSVKTQNRSKNFQKKKNEWKNVKNENSSKKKKKKNPTIISLNNGDISMEDNINKIDSDVRMSDSIVMPNLNSFSMDSISVLQCKLCPATFNTQKGLERHIKNIHETDANYNPKNEHGIKRKIENTNGNIIEKTSNKKKQATNFYKCKLCAASFKEKKTHDRHLKNIHSTNEDYKYNLQQGKKRKRELDPPKKSRSINLRNQDYKKWK